MRKVISAVIEEIMLILYLVWVGNNFTGRFTSAEQLWIMGITIGITIIKNKGWGFAFYIFFIFFNLNIFII